MGVAGRLGYENLMSSSLENTSASLERADPESVLRDYQLLMQTAMLDQLTTALPCVLLILNAERQVVYKNQQTPDPMDFDALGEILGKRLGEILTCIHDAHSSKGCGATKYCHACGFIKAMNQSKAHGATVVHECSIMTVGGGSYEFRVWATPYRCGEKDFTIFTLLDISNEKRRDALERNFFHDVNNLLNMVVGYSHLAEDETDLKSVGEYIKVIQRAGSELVEEVAAHQSFLLAERGDLFVKMASVDSRAVFVDVMNVLSAKDRQKGWTIVLDERSDHCVITTDQVLLRRVLGLMVKNALEVTTDVKEIHLACQRSEDSLVFSVHTAGHMPRSVILQLSQHSSTDKEKVCDIRTYSMKLFGEKYLKGNIEVSAAPGKGTTLFFSLPLKRQEASHP
jgi:hypothetical protein